MDSDLLLEVESAALAEGVTTSAWLARAAEDRLAIIGLREFIADWESQHGEITREERRRARSKIDHAIATSGQPKSSRARTKNASGSAENRTKRAS